MKKVMVISSVLLGVVLLSGCGQQPVNQTRPTAPAPESNISNIFTDSFVGYEIKYPASWIVSKNETSTISDSEGGKVSRVVISSNADGSLPDVGIYSMNIGQTAATIKTGKPIVDMTATDAIGEIKKTYLESGRKIYDEGEYVYKFADGSTVTGKQLKSESSGNGITTKEWLIVIVNGKDIFRFKFRANLNQYDAESKITRSMLDSWKISK